ncbi:MAG: hypothetical protein ACJAYE_000375 [Candidatus Azotimanducaceae bacterium]
MKSLKIAKDGYQIMIKRLIAIGMVGSFWLFSASAFAITPGNLDLTNTATLTYTGNPTGIEAQATVKVNVVASAPTLTAVADIIKAEGQSITTSALYTVTATNNGFDTYTFEPATLTSGDGLTDTSANVNFTGVSYIYKSAGGTTIADVQLGASALNVVSTASATITVPSDGTPGTEVNGLEQNDTVIIGGVSYTIDGTVTDSGSGSVTLTLNTAVPASLPIGTGVFERTTFTARTDGANGVGTQTVSGTTTTYDVLTTLQTTLTAPFTATATDTFQVTIVNVTIEKYVRNETRANCTVGTCTAFSYDSGLGAEDYYLTTGTDVIDARPLEVLEYLLVVTTPASGGTLALAVMNDVLADFTSYNTGTLRMNAVSVNDEGAGDNSNDNAFTGTFPLDPTADDNGLLIQTTAVGSSAEGDGGVANSSSIEIVYKVTIN